MADHFKTCQPSQLDRDEFVLRFGDIYEHSPWVAEQTWELGLDARHDRIQALRQTMATVFLNAGRGAQLRTIAAHPDLAGKAAVRGELTASSSMEQSSAGLDACTQDQWQRFQDLNQAYRERFGFPFIMAVKGKGREEILAAFAQRLGNDGDEEFVAALREINKIAALRLTDS